MSRTPRKVIVKESTGHRIIEQSRVRLLSVGLFFILCFGSIALRLVEVVIIHNPKAVKITVSDLDSGRDEVAVASQEGNRARDDIVDRNGELVATSLVTASVYANPKEIRNAAEAAMRLAPLLAMDSRQLLSRLQSGKSFVWIKRNVTPREQQAVNSLGIPGLYFSPEERRVYPYGNLLAHVLGYVGVDNQGLAGMEKQFDLRLRSASESNALQLAIDVRLQALLHDEMEKAVSEFHAIGATGVIMDIDSGELLSLVSLPDFDPHRPGKAADMARFNRAALGTYEMGSTFKSFTLAMALEYGTVTMKSGYDATNPLKISTFTIQDTHPQKRYLTIPEIYAYSSNIGAAKTALDVGTRRQKAFLEKIGMMKPMDIELPEKAPTLYPSDWKEINTVTISYGHGISVSPLHLVRGVAAITGDGTLPRLTLLKDGNKNKPEGERVVSEETSKNVRRLMRLVVDHGTAAKADVPGYRVGGKTGTAEKVNASGRYNDSAKLASFISVFPVDDPRYLILVMVDEPKGNKSTFGYATGGWIAAPIVGRVVSRMGPMLGIRPKFDTPEDDAEKFWVNRKPELPAAPAEAKTYLHAVSY